MTVHEFRPAVVGDGAKLDPHRIVTNLKPAEMQSIAVIYIDSNGELQCASTDGRAETLMLLERAKTQLVAGYLD